MAIYTDLIVATRDELESVERERWDDELAIIRAKNVDPVKVALLEQIVLGRDFEEFLTRMDSRFIDQFSQEDDWLYDVPEDLVAALTEAPSDERRRYAEEWAETEEWRADNIEARALVALLDDVTKLRTEARESHARLYIRIRT